MSVEASSGFGHGAARETGMHPAAAALETSELVLLQACVGFHAKAQTDPGIRDRLYRLWCKLEHLKPRA